MRFRLRDNDSQHEEIIDVEEVKPKSDDKKEDEKSPAEEKPVEEKSTDKGSSKSLSDKQIGALIDFVDNYLPLIKQMFGEVSDEEEKPAEEKAGEEEKKEDKGSEGEKAAEEKPAEETKDSEPAKSNDELTEDCDSTGTACKDSFKSCGSVKRKVTDSIVDHQAEICNAWQSFYDNMLNKGE